MRDDLFIYCFVDFENSLDSKKYLKKEKWFSKTIEMCLIHFSSAFLYVFVYCIATSTSMIIRDDFFIYFFVDDVKKKTFSKFEEMLRGGEIIP